VTCDDFESIFEIFELTAEDQSPFAAVDQTPPIPFETMKQPLKQIDEKLHAAAKDLYEFWRQRRLENGNHPLQPSLKFETHQDNDDGDPYVCFRRREVRQTRKTRARDVQSTEKLKRLRKEIEEGRNIVKLVLNRELAKRELLKTDKDIFEARSELKSIKIKAGIKNDDDELLINQKVCTVQTFAVISDTDSNSHKRESLRNSKDSLDHLEHSCACQAGQMAAHLMLT
jgi:enhancer of polycomb-like protein